MKGTEQIYSYLEEYSNETIDAYNTLMEEAKEGDVFTGQDIPALCKVLLEIETQLEDEHSYNIDWSIKDELVELILILALKHGVPSWAETIAQAINEYTQITRPFLETAVDTFISVLVFTSTSPDQSESIDNRFAFLDALQHSIPQYKELLLKFCERNIAQWMEGSHLTLEQTAEMALQVNNPVYGLYLFLKSANNAPIRFRDCAVLSKMDSQNL